MEQIETATAASKPVQRNPSRTAVIAVVILLIIIAIAGIVLAGRRTASPLPGTAAAVPDAPVVAAPQGRTQRVAAAPTAGPNDVVFAAGSDRLPAEAGDKIAKFADRARAAGGMVRMSAKYVTGANKAKDLELGKSRAAAVRHALESNGIQSASMQVELTEMPTGTLSDAEADRVVLSLH